jgi:hypothetical protein
VKPAAAAAGAPPAAGATFTDTPNTQVRRITVGQAALLACAALHACTALHAGVVCHCMLPANALLLFHRYASALCALWFRAALVLHCVVTRCGGFGCKGKLVQEAEIAASLYVLVALSSSSLHFTCAFEADCPRQLLCTRISHPAGASDDRQAPGRSQAHSIQHLH